MNARQFIEALGYTCTTKQHDGYWSAIGGHSIHCLATTETEALAKLAEYIEQHCDTDSWRAEIAEFHGRFDALTTLGRALWPTGRYWHGLPMGGQFSAAWVLPNGERAITRHGGTSRQAEDRLTCAMEAMARSRRNEPAIALALDAVSQWRRAA